MAPDPPGDLDAAVIRANSRAFSAQDVDGMLACHAPDAVVEDKRHGGLLGWLRDRLIARIEIYDDGRQGLEVSAWADRRAAGPGRTPTSPGKVAFARYH